MPKESVTVTAHLVNGDLQQWAEPPALLTKLKALRSQGFEGKRLVHELLTDDWGAPPNFVVITDDATGEEFRIGYE